MAVDPDFDLSFHVRRQRLPPPPATFAQRLQSLVRSTLFGVYTATDVIGVEADGALKNVVAIAAGMADGLGAGDNTRVILRQVAAERQNGQAEYPAREQVDDLEQHPAS